MTPCEFVLHVSTNPHLYGPNTEGAAECARREPELVEHVIVCKMCYDRMVAFIDAHNGGHRFFLSTTN